ncbi:putative siderochrome-iron transporter [Exophiala viscosa]|nr:putative siderochrome-iron transporter [Exophiala viscosa]
MQILNQIIVADITTSRWRGLANGLVNLPFMIIPWISAFIVDSALANIGWRWGIGMFTIIMPVCSIATVIPLIWFQRRIKRAGGKVRKETTILGFLSKIDVGGMVLLSGGCAMLLLPIALAGNTPNHWHTPWVAAVMAIGVICLIALIYYESRVAVRPIIPLRFTKNVSLVIAFVIGLLDAFAYSITHTYMYAWVTVVHDFSPRNATFLTYAAGCAQVLTGLATGFVMYRSRRYKWLLVIGVIIRLIGYGLMMRLRGASNSIAQLFIMQVIQGAGSGAVGTVVIVVAQIVVPRSELAQATALELLFIYLGTSLGSSIAGTIYTSLFKQRLRYWMGPQTPQSIIDNVYETITNAGPRPGSNERNAVEHAYSDILRYMTIAALVASAIPMVVVWFLPNLRLNDDHNLATDLAESKNEAEGVEQGGICSKDCGRA